MSSFLCVCKQRFSSVYLSPDFQKFSEICPSPSSSEEAVLCRPLFHALRPAVRCEGGLLCCGTHLMEFCAGAYLHGPHLAGLWKNPTWVTLHGPGCFSLEWVSDFSFVFFSCLTESSLKSCRWPGNKIFIGSSCVSKKGTPHMFRGIFTFILHVLNLALDRVWPNSSLLCASDID